MKVKLEAWRAKQWSDRKYLNYRRKRCCTCNSLFITLKEGAADSTLSVCHSNIHPFIHSFIEYTCYIRWKQPLPHFQSGPPTLSEEQTRNVVRAACHSVHVQRPADLDTGVFIRFYVPLPLLGAIPTSPETSLPRSSKHRTEVKEHWRTPTDRELSNKHGTCYRHRNRQEFTKHNTCHYNLPNRSLKVGFCTEKVVNKVECTTTVTDSVWAIYLTWYDIY